LYLGVGDSCDPNIADKVDGVLICAVKESSPIFGLLPASLPRVSLLTSVENITSVCIDEYGGGQMAVRYLMECGHRRIACLMEKHAWQCRRRYAGYCDALQEGGVEPDPAWKRLVGPVGEGVSDQPYVEWGRQYMQEWLSDGWKEAGCTAILVQNDVATIGVIQVLQEQGIKVPGEVSVISFDGTEICDLITPRLSAVALPLVQIGAKAVEILNRQIEGEASSPETIILPLGLRLGESVARIT
jgi:DNA-binding LacI/PurR family transcriptional regulator